MFDLPDGWESSADERLKIMFTIIEGPNPPVKRISVGVYEAHINFDHEIKHLILNEDPFFDQMRTYMQGNKFNEAERDRVFSLPHDYGVCDSWEQIIERWPILSSDPDHLFDFSQHS